jgi:uncharacterized protein YuzE
MKMSYHSDVDCLYIKLSETPSVDSEEVRPGVVLDFGADGQLVGIDIEYASKHIDLTTLDASSLPAYKAAI